MSFTRLEVRISETDLIEGQRIRDDGGQGALLTPSIEYTILKS